MKNLCETFTLTNLQHPFHAGILSIQTTVIPKLLFFSPWTKGKALWWLSAGAGTNTTQTMSLTRCQGAQSMALSLHNSSPPSLLLHTVLSDSISTFRTHFPAQTPLLEHRTFSHCRAQQQWCDALLAAGAGYPTPPAQPPVPCLPCASVTAPKPNPKLWLSPLQAGARDLLQRRRGKKDLNSVRRKQLAQIQSQLTPAAPLQLAHARSALLSTANIFLEELWRVLFQALECSWMFISIMTH